MVAVSPSCPSALGWLCTLKRGEVRVIVLRFDLFFAALKSPHTVAGGVAVAGALNDCACDARADVHNVRMIVACRGLGQRRPILDDFSVPPPDSIDRGDGDGGLTLRDLIEHVVRHEVSQFEQRQRERRFDRILTAASIEESLETRGKVTPGAAEKELAEQKVDVESAVATAMVGFEDGQYLVSIDGEKQDDLDKQIYLRPDSRLTFIRLTFLSGG